MRDEAPLSYGKHPGCATSFSWSGIKKQKGQLHSTRVHPLTRPKSWTNLVCILFYISKAVSSLDTLMSIIANIVSLRCDFYDQETGGRCCIWRLHWLHDQGDTGGLGSRPAIKPGIVPGTQALWSKSRDAKVVCSPQLKEKTTLKAHLSMSLAKEANPNVSQMHSIPLTSLHDWKKKKLMG